MFDNYIRKHGSALQPSPVNLTKIKSVGGQKKVARKLMKIQDWLPVCPDEHIKSEKNYALGKPALLRKWRILR